MSLPEASKLGVVNVSTPAMPKGMAKIRRYGRNLPQRVFVRSAIVPITRSFAASNMRVNRNSVPIAAAGNPNTSV